MHALPNLSAEEMLAALEESRSVLLATIADEPWFWVRPAPEKWAPAEIVEHIARVEESAARVLRRLRREAAGETLPPPQVAPGTFKDGKPQAPPIVQPKGGLSFDELLQLLHQSRQHLLEEVRAFDFSYGGRFPHPFYGPITGKEWLASLVPHEPHHLQQLLACKPSAAPGTFA